MGIDQKTPIASVDGTPVKHVIYSIISDYVTAPTAPNWIDQLHENSWKTKRLITTSALPINSPHATTLTALSKITP